MRLRLWMDARRLPTWIYLQYHFSLLHRKREQNQHMHMKGMIMDRQPNVSVSEDMARRQPANQGIQNHIAPKHPDYLLVGWILLLLLQPFFLFASVPRPDPDAPTH